MRLTARAASTIIDKLRPHRAELSVVRITQQPSTTDAVSERFHTLKPIVLTNFVKRRATLANVLANIPANVQPMNFANVCKCPRATLQMSLQMCATLQMCECPRVCKCPRMWPRAHPCKCGCKCSRGRALSRHARKTHTRARVAWVEGVQGSGRHPSQASRAGSCSAEVIRSSSTTAGGSR